MKIIGKYIATVLLFALGIGVSHAGTSPADRAEALLKQMTQEEKILLLGGDKDGFSTRAIDRLGIPKLIMADGPQGVRNYGKACSFPCGSALAATWDIELARRYGQALGLEARARGVHIQLGPGMNVCRQALNGRNFEYFGEDPFLAGKIAANWVRGIQSEGVMATIKHFACNNQEWSRTSVDVEVDERTLHEIYLPAFRRAIDEGGAWAVMCAYNRLRGTYCSENDLLLSKILKDKWGFKGLVMSDWLAVHSPGCLAAGLDLEMPSTSFLKEVNVKKELETGALTQARIDDAVRRILRSAIEMGFLDRKNQKRDDLPLDSPESEKVALNVARAAIVLLKNKDNALPLDRAKVKTVAIYGKQATDTIFGGGGSGSVNAFRRVSFLDGIVAVAGTQVKVIPVPMPNPKADFETFPTAFVQPGGEPGLTLSVERNGKRVENAPAVIKGMNWQWQKGELPLGVEAGGVVVFTLTGVLAPREDAEWQILQDGLDLSIGDETPRDQNHDLIALKKDKPVPIRIVVHAISGRSGRARFTLCKTGAVDLACAKSADAAVVCIGSFEGEAQDRLFELSASDRKMVGEVAVANRRCIVVNNSPDGLDMLPWNDAVSAIVQAWYPGQAGGTALAEILFGDANPSGRLPMTFDRVLTDNEAMKNYPGTQQPDKNFPVVRYGEGIFVGYRGYDKTGREPLYPFGHGLSYTAFSYANLKVEKTDDGAKVSLDITNTGQRDGVATPQIYVGQSKCSVERPKRELKGFAKVALKAGETKRVEISLPRDSFAFWSPEKKDWAVEPGKFKIEAGASARDIRIEKTFLVD